MYKGLTINKPFFEIGPKVLLRTGQDIELALFADALVEKYGVDIIYTAQYTDIAPIAARIRHLYVFAQHMDAVQIGRGIGAVLPEAVKDAGAIGVMLNHTERPLMLATLEKTVLRADEVGLATAVCADTPAQAQAVAHFSPNIIVAEAPELIGGGKRIDTEQDSIEHINKAIRLVNPEILVMHSAGITNDDDVFNVISKGAVATGSTSGIIKADDMFDMTEKMVCAVRRAYDQYQTNN